MRSDSIIDAIGHTPLVRLALDGDAEVYAKLELQNLFAMKDRVARQVILEARASGALAAGAPIIESSSGTMALGLALVGTALGHDVHIVTDPRIDPITLAKLEALGCVVHVVEAMTSQGWQSARLERLDALLADLDGAFWPRQYANPQNPAAYRALAEELRADLGRVDVLVGSVGSGGSLCGTARALRADQPHLLVVGVDAVGSVLFAQPDVPTRRQSGLGNSLHPDNVDHRLIDEVYWLADSEAFAATRALAREQKIFGGNTSGSVYQVLRHLAAGAAPGTRIVGILPDRGDRYVTTVYQGQTRAASGPPVRVRYGEPVSGWAHAVLGRDRPRLLFVESNTTGTGMLALRTAVRLGLEPVLLTSRPSRYAGLDATGCRVVAVDTNDPAELATAVSTMDGKLAGITTTSEFYLVTVAELAHLHGVPGNPVPAMAACRDKSRTRTVLAAAGVPQPRFAVVRDVADVAAALDRVGLPCVVKPADDSGSNDVLLCDDAAAVSAHAAAVLAVATNVRDQPTAGAVLVEEYLDGPEYSVETFGDGGPPVCVGVTRKWVTPPPYFVEYQHVFPAQEPVDDLVDAVSRALAATGVDRGATHTEIRRTATGPSIVEINARLAGGMIPELVRLATGVDLLEQQLRSAVGLPVLLAAQRSRVAGIRFLLAERDGVLTAVAGVAEARRVPGVDRVHLTVAPGDAVRRPRNAYDRLGYVIAAGTSAAEVEQALDSAVARLELVITGSTE